APPDHLVISQSTQQAIAPFYSTERLESFVLRGRAEPVVAHRVIAPTSATTPFEAAQKDGLARLAGRTRELEALMEAFESARGEELRELMLRAIVDLFVAVSKKNPVLLVMEDWHSADEGSSTAAAHVAQSIEKHPIFLAISHRPSDALVWKTAPSKTIELRPLDPGESALLSESILGT